MKFLINSKFNAESDCEKTWKSVNIWQSYHQGESPIFVSRGMNLAISAGLLVFLRKSSIHVATVVNDSRKEHIFCSFANGTILIIHNGKIRCHWQHSIIADFTVIPFTQYVIDRLSASRIAQSVRQRTLINTETVVKLGLERRWKSKTRRAPSRSL